MAKYSISYARYKLDANGKKGSGTSTTITVEATSDYAAMEIVKSKHPGYFIEIRSIKEK